LKWKINLHAKKKHFSKLKKYAQSKKDYKNGMKALLKLRAKNLLKIAFIKGLKRIWRQKIIQENMNKAADIFNVQNSLKLPMKILKKKIYLKAAAKRVRMNRFKYI
jgi:hypothetical protein